MNGCIYRTKDNECDLWNKDRNCTAFCHPNCENAHPSNYDRIISKSPEELSEFCIWMCPPGYNENFACEVERERCYNCWFDWLKQEAAE